MTWLTRLLGGLAERVPAARDARLATREAALAERAKALREEVEEMADRGAEAVAGGDDEKAEALREGRLRRRLERVLRGEAALPIGRFVRVTRQEGDEGAPNGEPFHVRIRASTDGLARDGGVIPLRISVFDELDADQRALVSFWRFHEESDESRLARRLYEGGFMRAASVGFAIHDWHEPDEDELAELREQENVPDSAEIRWVADEAELLEESAVAVPADPGALALDRALNDARGAGLDVGPLAGRLRELRRRCRAGDAAACRRLAAEEEDAPKGDPRVARFRVGDEVLEVDLRPGEAEHVLRERVTRMAAARAAGLEEEERWRRRP